MDLTKATTKEIEEELAKRKVAGRRDANIKEIIRTTRLTAKDLEGASDAVLDFIVKTIRGTNKCASPYVKAIFDWLDE